MSFLDVRLFAQTIIHIETGETHNPLPFATIVNHTKHLLLFSDKFGNANTKFENGDSINISYVGYDNIIFIFKKQNIQNYILHQKNDLLKTVEIKPCEKIKYLENNNLENDNPEAEFGGLQWNFPSTNAKVAVMVKPSFDIAYLNSFSFWLVHNAGAPKIAILAPLKFFFYKILDSSLLPGELISNRQIIYFPKKEGKQTVTLDSLHLRIPENGMYVGIECIIENKYKFPLHIINTEKGIDSIIMGYGARLDGVKSKEFRIAFYNYFQDKWFYPGYVNKSTLDIAHGTLKFSSVIKYCE